MTKALILLGLACVITIVASTRLYNDIPHRVQYRGTLKWRKKVSFDYYIVPGSLTKPSVTSMVKAVKEAFKIWTKGTRLTFKLVRIEKDADIKIKFVKGNHGDGVKNKFTNRNFIHTFPPNDRRFKGEIHLDVTDRWTTSTRKNSKAPYDMVTMIAHQIGHALGLPHSRKSSDLMGSKYKKSMRKTSKNDKKEINKRYTIKEVKSERKAAECKHKFTMEIKGKKDAKLAKAGEEVLKSAFKKRSNIYEWALDFYSTSFSKSKNPRKELGIYKEGKKTSKMLQLDLVPPYTSVTVDKKNSKPWFDVTYFPKKTKKTTGLINYVLETTQAKAAASLLGKTACPTYSVCTEPSFLTELEWSKCKPEDECWSAKAKQVKTLLYEREPIPKSDTYPLCDLPNKLPCKSACKKGCKVQFVAVGPKNNELYVNCYK
jgi:predicted Zn-dependent protease